MNDFLTFKNVYDRTAHIDNRFATFFVHLAQFFIHNLIFLEMVLDR